MQLFVFQQFNWRVFVKIVSIAAVLGIPFLQLWFRASNGSGDLFRWFGLVLAFAIWQIPVGMFLFHASVEDDFLAAHS